ELDRLRACLFQDPPGVPQRLFRADLIGEERHIHQRQRPPCAPAHRLRMVEHRLHGDRNGIPVAQDGCTDGVTHKDNINPGVIEQPCRGVVVTGDHHDLLTPLLLLEKEGHGDSVLHGTYNVSPFQSIGSRLMRCWSYYPKELTTNSPG